MMQTEVLKKKRTTSKPNNGQVVRVVSKKKVSYDCAGENLSLEQVIGRHEDAIQRHREQGGGTTVEEFRKKWNKYL